METKTCSKCGEIKSLEFFALSKTGTNGRAAECKQCHKERDRIHFEKNKRKILDQTQQWRKKSSEWFAEYKKTLKCEICGENHPSVIQFHHKDPSIKKESISLMYWKVNKEKVMEEIEKCSVLCANCHFKLHWNERNNENIA